MTGTGLDGLSLTSDTPTTPSTPTTPCICMRMHVHGWGVGLGRLGRLTPGGAVAFS
jgi:hypothetical protein